MKIVSACLAGVKCGYDGKARPCEQVIALVARGEAIPVCPEQLGGLTTPRVGAEQQSDGRIVTVDGGDVTTQYSNGADEALKIAQLAKCSGAILKARSPMCGAGQIYDGTFTKTLRSGDGIFAQKLKATGIEVQTDED